MNSNVLRNAVVCMGFAMIVIVGPAIGQTRRTDKPVGAEKQIPSTTGARQRAFASIEADREKTVGAVLILLSQADQLKEEPFEQTTGSRLYYAVRTAGLLHVDEAAVPLLDLIDLRFTEWMTRISAPADADVIQALARIGKPASKAAVEYLAKDKSSKRAPMYVRVIALVEGVEVGKFMVERAAAAESDPQKKARLTKAIALFADADKVVP